MVCKNNKKPQPAKTKKPQTGLFIMLKFKLFLLFFFLILTAASWFFFT